MHLEEVAPDQPLLTRRLSRLPFATNGETLFGLIHVARERRSVSRASSGMSRSGLRRCRLLLLPAIFMVVSACSNDDTYLPALLADPMASYEADGIELIDRRSQGNREERPFPSSAQVNSFYRILDESQAELVLERALDSAETGGWEMSPSPPIPNRFIGYKGLGVGEGRLIIVTAPDDEGSGQRLHILLGFSSLDASDG